MALVWKRVITTIDFRGDISITDLADNDVLAWDTTSSKWINQSIAEIADAVVIASPTDGDLAYYSTDTWVGQSLSELDIVTAAAALTDGKVVTGAGEGKILETGTLAWDEATFKLSGMKLIDITLLTEEPAANSGQIYYLDDSINPASFWVCINDNIGV